LTHLWQALCQGTQRQPQPQLIIDRVQNIFASSPPLDGSISRLFSFICLFALKSIVCVC